MPSRDPLVTAGFTLVELLLVLVILAIGAATAALALPDAEADALGAAAERSAALMRHVREQAILGSEPLAVLVDPVGYRVERRIQGRWTAAAGNTADDTAFTSGRWPPATKHIALTLDGRASAGGGRIVFDSDGYHPDFTLDLIGGHLRVRLLGTPVDGIARADR